MIKKVSNNLNIFTNQSTQSKRNEKITENKKLSRVEEIKKQIKNGEYKIDLKNTAEAMAKYLLK